MTHTQNAVTDLADANIAILAAKALTGEMPEAEARWFILEEIEKAGIADQVARSTPDIDNQMRNDLRERLGQLIETKILLESDGGFDLRQVRTRTDGTKPSSACGYARELAKSAVRSSLRDIRHYNEKYLPVDPTDDPMNSDDEVRSHAALAFHRNTSEFKSFDQELRDLETEEHLEEFNETIAGARSTRRLHEGARAIRREYKLAELIRPSDMLERESIRAALEADDTLAYRSVQAHNMLVEDQESAQTLTIDDKFLALWDDYTTQMKDILDDLPFKVAHALALAAVAAYPKPSRDAVEKTASMMTLVSGNDASRAASRTFRPLAKSLVDSWVASECEAVSEFNTKSAELTIEQEAAHMDLALSFNDKAAWAANLPGAPFGRHAGAVAAFIHRQLDSFSNESMFSTADELVEA